MLAGCDEAVTPPDEIDAYFTLWGALSPAEDQQALRVIPIQSDIEQDGGAPIEATMYSTDLTTGDESVWRDSLVSFSGGSSGHVFVSDFRARYGRRYRIAIERVDGALTVARVRVPPLVDAIAGAPVVTVGNVRYPIVWPGAPQLNEIEVTYDLENENCERIPVTIPFEGDAEPFEFGWETTIDLDDDASRVLRDLLFRPHAVHEITLSLEIASEDWRPPGGVFDEELLIEPGTFSNVDGGFGFVGSSYRTSTSWEPTVDELSRVAFSHPSEITCSH